MLTIILLLNVLSGAVHGRCNVGSSACWVLPPASQPGSARETRSVCAVHKQGQSSTYFFNRSFSEIDHLHNYGLGKRKGASLARIGCDKCVSHLSFRTHSALEWRSATSVVFLAVPIEAGLVLHSSLVVLLFHGQVSSGSAAYLPFVKLSDRTSASRTTHSSWYAMWARPPWDSHFRARVKEPVYSSITGY